MRKTAVCLLALILALSLLPAGVGGRQAAGEDSQGGGTRHASGWEWESMFTPQETEPPVSTEIPRENKPPVSTEIPRETETPVITEKPRETEAPVSTEKPRDQSAGTAAAAPTADPGDPGGPITSLRLPGKLQINVGETLDLSAEITVQPAGAGRAGITYSSSKPEVASVSPAGVITAVGPGTAAITAASLEKKTGKTVVTVIQPVTEITISESSVYLGTGKTVTLKAAVLPENASNKKVKWETGDSTVATVSGNGMVRGVSSGSTYVYCRATDGSNVVTARKVTVYVPVKRVAFSGKSMDLFAGQSAYVSFNLEPVDATDKRIEWSSSNPSIAKVSATTGYVTGVSAGKAILTARCLDGSGTKATHTVYVEPKAPVTVDYLWWETDRLGIMTKRIKVDAISNCLNKEVKSIKFITTAYANNNLKLTTTEHTQLIRLRPGKRATSSYDNIIEPKLNSCRFVELEIASVTFRDGTIYMYPDDIRKATLCRFEINNY